MIQHLPRISGWKDKHYRWRIFHFLPRRLCYDLYEPYYFFVSITISIRLIIADHYFCAMIFYYLINTTYSNILCYNMVAYLSKALWCVCIKRYTLGLFERVRPETGAQLNSSAHDCWWPFWEARELRKTAHKKTRTWMVFTSLTVKLQYYRVNISHEIVSRTPCCLQEKYNCTRLYISGQFNK